jgi:hypothetical protein
LSVHGGDDEPSASCSAGDGTRLWGVYMRMVGDWEGISCCNCSGSVLA